MVTDRAATLVGGEGRAGETWRATHRDAHHAVQSATDPDHACEALGRVAWAGMRPDHVGDAVEAGLAAVAGEDVRRNRTARAMEKLRRDWEREDSPWRSG